jgi:DNA-binding NarL/FixJ family response regulator
MLWGLQNLIEGEWPRMVVVGTAGTMTQALTGVGDRSPDVVVLDIQLGDDNARDRISELVGNNGPQVVILTGLDKMDLHERAMKGGARAVVLKDEAAEVLLREIERANQSRDAGVT